MGHAREDTMAATLTFQAVFGLVLIASGPALAQSLDGSINSGLGGGIGSGLGGGIQSGLPGTLGSTERGRTGARIDRMEVDTGGCAPGQVSLNRSGCRPIREVIQDAPSSYDLSIQAMSPLQGQTLRGLTLDPGSGPAGPD